MKPKKCLFFATSIVFTNVSYAAPIDVNRAFDYTATNTPIATVINWSSLTWAPSSPTFAAGVTAGIPNGVTTTSTVRILNLDGDVTLKQIQFYNSDATVFSSDNGSKITWDSGVVGVQCDLGRNRHAMTNYAAGRSFTVSPDFVLNSDLRVTNWAESNASGSRITTINSTVSGAGKLTLRVLPWTAGGLCPLVIGGSTANTHLGGTTLVVSSATVPVTVNKPDAFGTGLLTLDGNGIINANLNGNSQTVAGLASSGNGAHVFGNDLAAAEATVTLQLKDGVTSTFSKHIGSLTAPYGNNLALVVDKASGSVGTGVQVLSGTNSFTGATTVTGGSLRIVGANALTGSMAVSVGTGATFHYQALADVPLVLPGTLSLTGGTNTLVGTAIGAGATSATIAAAGVASATGLTKLDVVLLPGASPAPGSYTLLSGGAGSSLNGGTYSRGLVWNATNVTVGTPTATTTEVTTVLTATTPLATAYWKGGFAGKPNVWAVSNGTSAGNWTTDPAGTIGSGLVPGATTKVVISATGASAQGAMVLGTSMSIGGMTVSDSAAVSLTADGSSLTISPASASDGIKVQSGAGVTTIATPVILGANQTWSNASTNPLTVSGVVSGGSGITVSGPGTTVLSGTNTFTGGVNLSGGSLLITKAKALGDVSGTFTLGGGATLDNTAGANLITPSYPLIINGDFTFTGSNELNLGNGAVTLGSSAGTARIITVSDSVLTIDGTISNGTTAIGLTKAGSGILSCIGQSTYTGPTTVLEGALEMQGTVDGSSSIKIAGGAFFDVSVFPFYLIGTQTLGGNGTVTGNVQTFDASVVSPGLSVGTLNVTGDIAIGSTLAIEISGAATDKLAVGGALNLSQATLNVTAVSANAPAYVIATYGSLVGEFLSVGSLPTGYNIDYAYNGNQVALVAGGVTNPFGNWISDPAFGLALGDQGTDADPDHDGIRNILEFALNGNPSDASKNGISALVIQDTNATTGKELTLVAAVRRGAIFTGTGPLEATVDGVAYKVGGSASLADFNSPVNHASSSNTAPAGANLPDLTGSDWEYHTFSLKNSDGLPGRGFLRIGASAAP